MTAKTMTAKTIFAQLRDAQLREARARVMLRRARGAHERGDRYSFDSATAAALAGSLGFPFAAEIRAEVEGLLATFPRD